MTADEFLKDMQVKAKASKIEPFEADIVKLREAGASYSQILEFLRINNLVVTYSSLADWMRRHLPAELLAPPKKQPTKSSQSSKQPTSTPQSVEVLTRDQQSPAPSYFDKKRKPEVNLDFLDEE